MRTILGTVVSFVVWALVAWYFDIPIMPITAGILGAGVWITWRVARAFGIRKELLYLSGVNATRMREWDEYGDTNEGESRTHIRNRLVRSMDTDAEDARGLKRIQW